MSFNPKDKKFKNELINGKKIYQCLLCQRNFARFNLFTYHIKSRESNYPFQCKYCCEKRQKKSLLIDHYNKYHRKMGKASEKESKSQKRQNESSQNDPPSQRARMGATNILVSPGTSKSSIDSLKGSSQNVDSQDSGDQEMESMGQVKGMDTQENFNDGMSKSKEGDDEEMILSNFKDIVTTTQDPDDDTFTPDLDKTKQQDVLPQEPINNEWTFKLWGLLSLHSKVYGDCTDQEKVAIKILQGTTMDQDVEKLVSLLDAGLEASFGTFIASLIVVSVLKKAKVETLLLNYDRLSKLEFSQDLKFVLNELMIGIFKTKRIELYKSKAFIPSTIASAIFCNLNAPAKAISNDITGIIMQSIYISHPKYKFFDKNALAKNRVKMWCKIYQSWCDNLHEINLEFISIICKEASKMEIATDVTVVLKDQGKLYLHSAAFEKTFGMKITNSSVNSDLSNHDFKKIADLLYGKGSIPNGGYRPEMIDLLFDFGCNSENVYNFLFRDKSTMEECFSSFEYDNLLYFAIKLRKIKADKSNFSKWNTLFKAGCVMSKIRQFTVRDLNYMFGKDGFEVDEIDVYKFLILWSTGNTCQFEKVRVKDFECAQRKFDEVKGLIKNVEKLGEIFHLVCFHGFLDIAEYL